MFLCIKHKLGRFPSERWYQTNQNHFADAYALLNGVWRIIEVKSGWLIWLVFCRDNVVMFVCIGTTVSLGHNQVDSCINARSRSRNNPARLNVGANDTPPAHVLPNITAADQVWTDYLAVVSPNGGKLITHMMRTEQLVHDNLSPANIQFGEPGINPRSGKFKIRSYPITHNIIDRWGNVVDPYAVQWQNDKGKSLARHLNDHCEITAAEMECFTLAVTGAIPPAAPVGLPAQARGPAAANTHWAWLRRHHNAGGFVVSVVGV